MKKSKRIKKSNSWKIKQHRDQFFKKSKTLGYRSRASFKLIELNKKYKFIKSDTSLLDLGACPGGWSQIATQIVTTGKILSVDVKEMEPIHNVKFLKGDSIRTNQLCADVINFAKDTLKPKGVLVSKLFMGEDFIEVKNLAKTTFKKVNFFKPNSSRKESKETYLHCEILRTL
jgi:23S rRNA (uridine2552-2'-O)-methyltransferase